LLRRSRGGRRCGRRRRHNDLRLGEDVAYLVLQPGGGLHVGVHLLVSVEPERIALLVRPEKPGLLLGIDVDLDGVGARWRCARCGDSHGADCYLPLLHIALRQFLAGGGCYLDDVLAGILLMICDLPCYRSNVLFELLGHDGVLGRARRYLWSGLLDRLGRRGLLLLLLVLRRVTRLLLRVLLILLLRILLITLRILLSRIHPSSPRFQRAGEPVDQ